MPTSSTTKTTSKYKGTRMEVIMLRNLTIRINADGTLVLDTNGAEWEGGLMELSNLIMEEVGRRQASEEEAA